MSNVVPKPHWWAEELDLEVSGDLYGEFYSVPMKQYADSLEERSDFQEYFELEHATARRLNAAYEGCARISTDLLEEGIIDQIFDAMEQGNMDTLQGILARIKGKNFYEGGNNDG